MGIYATGAATSITTASAASAELLAGSSARIRLLEFAWGVSVNPAANRTLAIGRPAATGITPTTPLTLQAVEPTDAASGTKLTVAGWGTAPTAPADFFRRWRVFHATWIIWEFPRGITIDVNKSVVLWNVDINPTVDVYVEVDE